MYQSYLGQCDIVLHGRTIAVKRSDLWDCQPQLPSSIHLNYVMETWLYNVAVDTACAMQRIITEVDGWQRWVHAVLGDTEPYNAE
jgi:hypothetical protein